MKTLYETIFDTTADPGEFLIELKPFLKDSKCKTDGHTLIITQFDEKMLTSWGPLEVSNLMVRLRRLRTPKCFEASEGFGEALRKCDIDTLINQTNAGLAFPATSDLDNLTIISNGHVAVSRDRWDEGDGTIINLSIEAPSILLQGDNDPTSYKGCKFKCEKIFIIGHEQKKSMPSLDRRCVLDTNELGIGRYPRRRGDTSMYINNWSGCKSLVDFYDKVVLPKKLIDGIETVHYEGAAGAYTYTEPLITVSKKKLSDECVDLLNDDMPWKYIQIA